ncbi:MAG: hypothetical protein AB1758_35710 [Candidatus Eremiobacterota bacterium]
MFGIFKKKGKPTLELVGQQDGGVQFKASGKLAMPPEGRLDAVAVLPDGQKFEVWLTELTPPVNGIYTAALEPRPSALLIAEFFARRAQQLYCKLDRGPTQHFRSLVVRAPEFPNFKGITLGLSMAEAYLVLDGPMQVGDKATVSLDLDDQQQTSLSIHCEVVACKPTPGRSTCNVMVRWLDLAGQQAAAMESYLRMLKKRGAG